MSELIDVIRDVSLVLAGTISGAVLTYLTSIRLEKRERNRRKRETATLLYGDIFTQLIAVRVINFEIDAITNAGDEKEEIRNIRFNELLSVADFYKRDVFLSVLRDLTLLPSDCRGAVVIYHTFAEKLNKELIRHLETKDLRALKVAVELVNGTLEFGITSLSYLRALMEKITLKEARALVRKDLSEIKEGMKEALKKSNRK